MRLCQYFAALLFLTPGSILYREFNILQQNIVPGLRISHTILIPGSVRHGIKLLHYTGMTGFRT